MADSNICVGVITGAHGVRGLVRVKSFTETPKDIAAYGPLGDAQDRRRFDLEITGSAKGLLVARIAGIDDRDAAQALRGVELHIARDALPQPDEDEFYHADLIGLPAFLADGRAYGVVRALHDFGAGDTIEIVLNDGGVIVLPFTRAVAPVVDLEAGRIVIEPPEEIEAREGGDGAAEEDA